MSWKDFYVYAEPIKKNGLYVEPVDFVNTEIQHAEKVKIFCGNDKDVVEKEINDFIKDKIFVDLRISAHTYSVTIIVIYKEYPF